jgi:hypothetical protein
MMGVSVRRPRRLAGGDTCALCVGAQGGGDGTDQQQQQLLQQQQQQGAVEVEHAMVDVLSEEAACVNPTPSSTSTDVVSLASTSTSTATATSSRVVLLRCVLDNAGASGPAVVVQGSAAAALRACNVAGATTSGEPPNKHQATKTDKTYMHTCSEKKKASNILCSCAFCVFQAC